MSDLQVALDFVTAWEGGSDIPIDYPQLNIVLEAARKHASLLRLVDEQAEDEGLWFVARTAPEAYLQQELRRLHAAIEEV